MPRSGELNAPSASIPLLATREQRRPGGEYTYGHSATSTLVSITMPHTRVPDTAIMRPFKAQVFTVMVTTSGICWATSFRCFFSDHRTKTSFRFAT